GAVYYLDHETRKVMLCGQDYSQEGQIPWSATLCQFDETAHGRKCYSRMSIRADMGAGSWLKAEVSTDGTPFKQVFTTHDELAKTVQIPIPPVRCDNFRIRLSGKGVCIIKSMVRDFELGSEA
ncbi:MAG: hypothetical protein RR949_06190, partial [Oscillospiraceae bacterium]